MNGDDFLNNLRTPKQISEHIFASSGVRITPRTIWEKACRIGVGRKIGRSMFVSLDDIPSLLAREPKVAERAKDIARQMASERSTKLALKILADLKRKTDK